MGDFNGIIVLLGPIGVGKTPIAEILSEELDIDHVMLDLMDHWREKVGWSWDAEVEIGRSDGVAGRFDYRCRFSIPMLQMVVEGRSTAVIDCGGDEFVVSTEQQRSEFRRDLRKLGVNYVAAILPFESEEDTLSYYRKSENGLDPLNEFVVKNPSHREVADRVFFTRGGALEKVAEEVLKWISE